MVVPKHQLSKPASQQISMPNTHENQISEWWFPECAVYLPNNSLTALNRTESLVGAKLLL